MSTYLVETFNEVSKLAQVVIYFYLMTIILVANLINATVSTVYIVGNFFL